ncbi:LacI family DNA-binding transcriptional regulator [Microlunatus soli]|uniref:LacI family transcriptional regulator n=1 Tax=Microlunatus soli TaxID=630515 RepID=A0A1H1UX59_9ACTN|nr:LacI family DNA-binding transcriptional regulator [Microlunatus soli]SDS77144.1 LacI family transcriptional regulator [Microlunatus soli]
MAGKQLDGRGRPSVRALARAAGVSPSTAARALAHPELLSHETRQAVLAAAEGLGYRPELPTRVPGVLGLLVPDIRNPTLAEFVSGAEYEASRRGHAILLIDTNESRNNESSEARSIITIVEAIVISSPRMAESELRDLAGDVRLVTVHRPLDGLRGAYIDTRDAIGSAVTHVKSLGHRDVTYVAGPEDSWASRSRAGKLADACARAGLELRTTGPYAADYDGGRAAAEQLWLDGGHCVFAFNALMAMGLINRLIERGLRVPEDVSVVGLDDSFATTLFTPHPTAIRSDERQLGRLAVELAVAAEVAREIESVPAALTIRQSTGVARPPTAE